MITRAQFCAAVETLVGTPIVHRGRVAGPDGGVDCVGVVLVALAACGVHVEESAPYGVLPDAEQLTGALSRHCDRVDEAQPGDLLQVFVGSRPRHVQVLVEHDHIVHAWAKGRVVRKIRRNHREAVAQAWRIREVG